MKQLGLFKKYGGFDNIREYSLYSSADVRRKGIKETFAKLDDFEYSRTRELGLYNEQDSCAETDEIQR